MDETVYLVFGDLHGRVLPAFQLAIAWGRRHGVCIAGILQVGDLGYFPDTSRLDKATARYAARDAMELGVQLVAQPSREADAVFAEPDVPESLWFTAGNHEDFEALESCASGAGRAISFPVDAYVRVQAIRDGCVAMLPGGLRVGALWGVDHHTRTHLPERGWIHPKNACALAAAEFDVLLTHDAPTDAMSPGSGSEAIATILRQAQPQFAFFGHYRGSGRRVTGDFGRTQVYHMAGMELRRRSLYPEEGCVGVLRWSRSGGRFEYVDDKWLLNYPRTAWPHWLQEDRPSA
jgi:hypothetical protein